MLQFLSSGVAFASDIPSKPSELGEWFQSGAATLFIIIFASKYVWDALHKSKEKHDARHDEDTKELKDTVRTLEQNLLTLKTKHESCRVNEMMGKLTSDIERFTERLGAMSLNWATDMAKKEATLTGVRDDISDLKAKVSSLSTDDVKVKLAKLDDKITAAFRVIDELKQR